MIARRSEEHISVNVGKASVWACKPDGKAPAHISVACSGSAWAMPILVAPADIDDLMEALRQMKATLG